MVKVEVLSKKVMTLPAAICCSAVNVAQPSPVRKPCAALMKPLSVK